MAHTPASGGFVNYGQMTVGSGAFGAGATYYDAPAARPAQAEPAQQTGVDVGIITMLSVEAREIRDALGLRPSTGGSPSFETGQMTAGSRQITIAAIRTLGQGEGPTITAFHHLRERHCPRVVILAGIAGGIHPDIRINDVVISTRVIYYDLRKETSAGTRHRGQERQAPAWVGHAVNNFFTDHGDAACISTSHGTFRALPGPIGSGNAVIADRDSEILTYLARYNDQILAVEMEAGGLSQAHHDQPATRLHIQGWAVVRGISDDAGKHKNDLHQRTAARNAAIAVREIIPYLLPSAQ
jgi:adenosylhomocysteine nucleosidase